MNKIYFLCVLGFIACIYGKDSIDTNKMNGDLRSSDANERLLALKGLYSGVERRISTYARQGGKEAILVSTRAYLEPFKAEIIRASKDNNSANRALSALLLGYATPNNQFPDLLITLAKDQIPDVQYSALQSLYLANSDTIESRNTLLILLGEKKMSIYFI